MKLVEILVHHHAHKQVAARLFLVRVAERFERLDQHLVGWPVADLVNHVVLGARDGPRFADRRATLRNHTAQRHAATHAKCHTAVLVHVAIQINLRPLRAMFATGQATEDGSIGPGGIPLVEPLFAVQMERISKNQPSVAVLHAGFLRPKPLRLTLLHLRLRKTDGVQFGFRQMIQRQHKARFIFQFLRIGDQTAAGATEQQWDTCVHAKDFQQLRGMPKKLRCGEDQP